MKIWNCKPNCFLCHLLAVEQRLEPERKAEFSLYDQVGTRAVDHWGGALLWVEVVRNSLTSTLRLTVVTEESDIPHAVRKTWQDSLTILSECNNSCNISTRSSLLCSQTEHSLHYIPITTSMYQVLFLMDCECGPSWSSHV